VAIELQTIGITPGPVVVNSVTNPVINSSTPMNTNLPLEIMFDQIPPAEQTPSIPSPTNLQSLQNETTIY
jgi:hypothetical protein